MPSRSSMSWKASPRCSPNAVRLIAVRGRRTGVDGADAARAGHQRRGLVRGHRPGTRRRSPRSRRSKARSAPWPEISRCTAAARQRGRPEPPAGPGPPAAGRWPGAGSASPARMAGPTPKTVHAVGRCRRSVSPSMMSSCSSEKLCTSSTATAAGTARSGGAPAARADSSASAGRSALPPAGSPVGLPVGTGQPEVVAGDRPDVRAEPGQGRLRCPGRPGPWPSPRPPGSWPS